MKYSVCSSSLFVRFFLLHSILYSLKIENTHVNEFFQLNEDPSKYDPYAEHFFQIEDAFDASIMSWHILIDDVTLPMDGCKTIAEVIIKGGKD